MALSSLNGLIPVDLRRRQKQNNNVISKSPHKIWFLCGCDHVLRRLDNERSCPMGYDVSTQLPGGGGGVPNEGLYGEAPPKEVPFSRFRYMKG